MKLNVFAAAASALAFCVLPLAAATTHAHQAKASKTETVRSRWPAESVTGQIETAMPSQKLLIVKGDSTIFDFRVTPSTRITQGHRKITLADLKAAGSRQVKVKFIPERRGDIASSIDLAQ